MNLTRRNALALGAGLTAFAMLPQIAVAAGDVNASIAAFTGGAKVANEGVELTAPEIAENGNTVPVEVNAPGAVSIILLAAGNPSPGVATFNFGPMSGAQSASTRIRLAKTQKLVAVAKFADGRFAMAEREVKVTIGGCGG